MAELLNCPFCGGNATTDAQFGREWWVECDDCQASTGGAEPTREAAVAAWNRRASVAASNQGRGVPREPTEAMLAAVRQRPHPNREDGWDSRHAEIWRRMWAAAPALPITPAAEQKDGWRPIATAPKDGTHVLIANDAPGSVHPREGYYVPVEQRYENEPTHEGWWRLAGSCEERVHGRTPSHWMPLPPPPALQGMEPIQHPTEQQVEAVRNWFIEKHACWFTNASLREMFAVAAALPPSNEQKGGTGHG